MTIVSAPHDHALPRRLFWRRAFAVLTDLIVFYVAIYAVMLAIVAVLPWNIGYSPLTSTSCVAAPPVPFVTQIETEWPLQPDETRLNLLCQTAYTFDGVSHTIVSQTVRRDGTTTTSRLITLATDENGIVLSAAGNGFGLVPTLAMVLAFLAFVSLMIWFSAGGRRTPGKRMLKLQITTRDGVPPGLDRAIRRETLKFAIGLIGQIVFVAAMTYTLSSLQSQAATPAGLSTLIASLRDWDFSALYPIFAISIIFGIAQILWWFLPFLFWRGQTYYDRIAGCIVARRT